MNAPAALALARHELRIMRTDPSTVVFIVVMPLGMAAFFKELYRGTLVQTGMPDASGAELAVPGMAIAFAAFGVGYSGFAFFRDHGWGTWDRLRAAPVSSVDILAGKVVPAIAVTIAQMLLLLGLGVPLLGLSINGPLVALLPLIVALSLSLNAFGVAVTAWSRTSQQLNALGSIGGMILATLGGAFVPLEAMPTWAQPVAPTLPTYWAMRGLRSVIIDGDGLAAVLLPTGMMVGFTALFVALAATRFRFEESKVYYG